jgi:uncharacterized small protein (DUF1192 family)
MNDPAESRLTSIDPGGGGAEADRWRAVNDNSDVISRLVADLQNRVVALEGEVARLRAAAGRPSDSDLN